MSCIPKCLKSASHDGAGHRIMVSVAGNTKFPIPHTKHGQCKNCAKEEMEHGRLMVLFNNDIDLVKKYEKILKK